MKAKKVTMAPKATTMKAPKSMKTMKAATAKGKSQKTKDTKDPSAYFMKRQTVYGWSVNNAKVRFYYGTTRPCSRTKSELKVIARVLSAGVLESGADQVTLLKAD